jgi:asparagine synthase (glutamine-hydrolysing)
MGGIVGLVSLNAGSLGDIEGMLKGIWHRGPDQAEFYREAPVQLGACGSKLDQKSLVSSGDGAIVCGFSGVLYNTEALARLSQRDGSFDASASPGKLILRLYETMGPELLQILEGQFSMVIYDGHKGQVILARDIFGVCPLFYSVTSTALVFASEIKAIARSGEVTLAPDIRGLYEGFVYWSTSGGRTVFNGIHQVPPGCWVTIDMDKDVNIQPYYCYAETSPLGPLEDIGTLQKRVFAALSQSLADRLGGAGSSGLFLSGGLDSTILLKLAQELGYWELPVFSLGFADSALDESPFQDLALKGHRGERYRVIVKDEDVIAMLPQVLGHCETPLFKLGPVPMFMLSKAARQVGVESVLCGEGADELFYGYEIFKETQYRINLALDPDSVEFARDIKHIVPPQYKSNPAILAMYSEHYSRYLVGEEDVLYSMRSRIDASSCIAKYFSRDNRAAIRSGEVDSLVAHQYRPRSSPLRQCQEVQMQVLLAGYLLAAQGDRVLMANSVEGRYPFLDRSLLELSLSIPDSLMLADYQEKYILKQTFAHLIPSPILRRQKYQYSAPGAARLFKYEDALAPYLTKEAFESCGVFDYNSVQRLIQGLKSGQAQPHQTISEEMMFTYILTTHMLLARVKDDFP